ncbi:MAG: hypothetical protein IT307_11260 [Chloroflexi bacterium]|nr:hypothetical protein [Chloroflexota bacterium]
MLRPFARRGDVKQRAVSNRGYEELTEHLAEAMFHHAMAREGIILGLAGVSPRDFLQEAAATLDAIALGTALPGPPTP